MATLIGTSKRLKEFIVHMFESKWEYSNGMKIRTHRKTGKVEHYWMDDWGGWYDSEPMFKE